MKRHRRDYEMMADMNLTNLLDTAFVLLIAFIIASPTMRPSGLKVDLPEVRDTPGELAKNQEDNTVTITIKRESAAPNLPEMIYANDDIRVDLTDGPNGLRSYLRAEKAKPRRLSVIIQADKDARYDVLAQVLALLRAEGITNVGLPLETIETDPNKKAGSK